MYYFVARNSDAQEYFDRRLLSGWYYGTNEKNYLDYIVKLMENIAIVICAEKKKEIFKNVCRLRPDAAIYVLEAII